MTTTLPDTLSGLLRLAVRDAQACEADPRYTLDMDVWHIGGGETCHVCMAGAVMAQTLGFDRGDSVDSMIVENPMLAINGMREGRLLHAWEDLHGYDDEAPEALYDLHAEMSTEYLAAYRENYDQERARRYRLSWDRYLYWADRLEEIGL